MLCVCICMCWNSRLRNHPGGESRAERNDRASCLGTRDVVGERGEPFSQMYWLVLGTGTLVHCRKKKKKKRERKKKVQLCLNFSEKKNGFFFSKFPFFPLSLSPSDFLVIHSLYYNAYFSFLNVILFLLVVAVVVATPQNQHLGQNLRRRCNSRRGSSPMQPALLDVPLFPSCTAPGPFQGVRAVVVSSYRIMLTLVFPSLLEATQV